MLDFRPPETVVYPLTCVTFLRGEAASPYTHTVLGKRVTAFGEKPRAVNPKHKMMFPPVTDLNICYSKEFVFDPHRLGRVQFIPVLWMVAP